MNKNSVSPFVRKIIYIGIIALLLIPLSSISRPEVTGEDGVVVDSGGRLSQMRRKHRLAQASISEIDPTSEAMKLASMGLRGVAVNVLWMQALEHQKNEDYDKLAATLQTLTKVQPNFVKVWEFQGHNLAFNVSMEFDDYEYRYEWVKKGLKFLKGGIAYNIDDHRMTDNMGFFTGTKFGKSDEKLPFRRIFRKDEQFHIDMDDKIARGSYDAREYGPDSYKMAWHWYDESEKLVDKGGFKFKSDLMFYSHRPAQSRQQAMILAEEFRPDEVNREIWEDAEEQWLKYGNVELRNASSSIFSLEKYDQYESRVEELREELDAVVPGVRKTESVKLWREMGLGEEQLVLMSVSLEELDDEQKQQRLSFTRRVNESSQGFSFDGLIATQATPEKRLEANRIATEIQKLLGQMKSISKDGGVINYSFWKSRNAAEATDAVIRARQAMHDAYEMRLKSSFEDEYVLDYETKEKQITRIGARKLFEEAFSKWDEVLQVHPDLVDSPVVDNLVDFMREYDQLLLVSGKQWPDDFALQWAIDQRAKAGENDQLPTSEDIKAMREDAEDAAEGDEDDEEEMKSKKEMEADAEKDAKAEKPMDEKSDDVAKDAKESDDKSDDDE